MLLVICYLLFVGRWWPESPRSLVSWGLADGQPPTFPIFELTRKINQSQEIGIFRYANATHDVTSRQLRKISRLLLQGPGNEAITAKRLSGG